MQTHKNLVIFGILGIIALGISGLLNQNYFTNSASIFEKTQYNEEVDSGDFFYKDVEEPTSIFSQENTPNNTGTQGNGNPTNFTHGNMGNQINNTSNFQFKFANNFAIKGTANQNISLTTQYDSELSNRFFGFHLNNEEYVDMSLYAQSSFLYSQQSQIAKPSILFNLEIPQIPMKMAPVLSVSEDEAKEYNVDYSYSAFYSLDFDGSYESIQIYSILDPNLGIQPAENQDISWAIFDNSTNQWNLIDTSISDGNISALIYGNSVESSQLILTLVYISPVSIAENFWTSTLGLIIIGLAILTIVFGSLMSQQEYRDYLLNRFLPINKGPHRLTMEEVLENENRNNIISAILDKPGIHFNELLREINISAGTLAWHLDILDTFKVIRKERVGQYLLYFSFLDTNPISKLDSKLQKSRTTLEIMQIVKDNPGIYQNKIAKRLDLDHKTVKYHLDKLKEADIVISKKSGRRNLFYPTDFESIISE
ncbi:hypothetical protein NEF87_000619 [Candidatus Lokiarchaeum ossiferum]|uniref:HVO-0163 N-terminal HTH domain-containing protein n=1 Tax=Candidatus Lokiarchaeum ossiferum TaxID=2951803 RepID=A0ABY6HLE9_9ARCH|nr:hypothetical protein NEF87_000619 [Candidatus Lokiarchaeum sp. B-35]